MSSSSLPSVVSHSLLCSLPRAHSLFLLLISFLICLSFPSSNLKATIIFSLYHFFLFFSHTLLVVLALAHPIFYSSYPISLPLSSSVTNILLNLLSSSTVSIINFIGFLSHTLFLLHSSGIFSFPHSIFCFISPSLLNQHPLFYFLSLHLNCSHPLHFFSLAYLSLLPSFRKSSLPLRHDHSTSISLSLQLLFVCLFLSCNRTFSKSPLASYLSSSPFRFSSSALLPPLILVIPSYSFSSSSLPHQPSLSFSRVLFISKFLLKSLPLPLTIYFPLFEALAHSLSFDHHTLSATALLRFQFHLRILPLFNSFLPFSLILFHSLPLSYLFPYVAPL